MWKNVVEPDRPQMTIWRMAVTCRVNKARNMLSDYVEFITFSNGKNCRTKTANCYVLHTDIAPPVQLLCTDSVHTPQNTV